MKQELAFINRNSPLIRSTFLWLKGYLLQNHDN